MLLKNLILRTIVIHYAYFLRCTDEQEEPLLEDNEIDNYALDENKYQIYSPIQSFTEEMLKKRLFQHEHLIDKYHIDCRINISKIDTHSESIRIMMNEQAEYGRSYVLTWEIQSQENMSDLNREMNYSVFQCNEYIKHLEENKLHNFKMKLEDGIIYLKIGKIKSMIVSKLYLVQNLATLKNLKAFYNIISRSSKKSAKNKLFMFIFNKKLNTYDRFVIFKDFFKKNFDNLISDYVSVMITQEFSEYILDNTVNYLKKLKSHLIFDKLIIYFLNYKRNIDCDDLDNNLLEYTLYLNKIDILEQITNQITKIRTFRNSFLGPSLMSFFEDGKLNRINVFILPDLRIEIIEKPENKKILGISRNYAKNRRIVTNIYLSMYDYEKFEFVFILNQNKKMIKSYLRYYKNGNLKSSKDSIKISELGFELNIILQNYQFYQLRVQK